VSILVDVNSHVGWVTSCTIGQLHLGFTVAARVAPGCARDLEPPTAPCHLSNATLDVHRMEMIDRHLLNSHGR